MCLAILQPSIIPHGVESTRHTPTLTNDDEQEDHFSQVMQRVTYHLVKLIYFDELPTITSVDWLSTIFTCQQDTPDQLSKYSAND